MTISPIYSPAMHETHHTPLKPSQKAQKYSIIDSPKEFPKVVNLDIQSISDTMQPSPVNETIIENEETISSSSLGDKELDSSDDEESLSEDRIDLAKLESQHSNNINELTNTVWVFCL